MKLSTYEFSHMKMVYLAVINKYVERLVIDSLFLTSSVAFFNILEKFQKLNKLKISEYLEQLASDLDLHCF